MSSFTIKDLANLSGIKAHTLRIWEQRYHFLKPSRTGTNIRYYSNDELKTILNIALLNRYGFKISHIDKMSQAEVREKILSLNQLPAQHELIVHDLIDHMIQMQMEEFESTLNKYITSKGIERAITQVIFPFLEKIGILWQTNHIIPAQEHLVSNIIRQKLIAGIEQIRTPLESDKKVLLFLPEGEYHELGLLFMQYLLVSRGVKVVYLGASVPLDNLKYVVDHTKPDYLYSHLTSAGHNFNLERFLHAATERFKPIPLFISGQLTQVYAKKLPPSVIFKKSYPEVMNFIMSLQFFPHYTKIPIFLAEILFNFMYNKIKHYVRDRIQ